MGFFISIPLLTPEIVTDLGKSWGLIKVSQFWYQKTATDLGQSFGDFTSIPLLKPEIVTELMPELWGFSDTRIVMDGPLAVGLS